MTYLEQLELIRKLRDMGVAEAKLDNVYSGGVRVSAISYVRFSDAAQLDAVVKDQPTQLASDPRLTPEEQGKIKDAARERMLYGGPLEE